MAGGRWIGIPSSWNDVVVRALKVAVTGFVVLVLKEYMETREWDIPVCAIDASWVAGGTFLLNALLLLVGGRPKTT